jgi:hypothetical protein
VVTIDDILDYLLPDVWRSHDEDDDVLERIQAVRADTQSIPISKKTTQARRMTNGTNG